MESGSFVTEYAQIPGVHSPWVLASYQLYLGALGSSLHATRQIEPLLKKERVQFLCLHHVFNDEVEPFRDLLRGLSRDHTFIGYSEAIERIWKGNIDRPYIVISFDDGLRNCLRASQIMDEFGAKGCFFICPSMIGETDYRRIREFCAQKLEMPPVEFLSWDDVERILEAGHEIGGHTMSHPNLAQLSIEQVRAEFEISLESLRKRVGQVSHFAWPYGRLHHFSPGAARLVFETGYRSCASVERGCHITKAINPADLLVRRKCVLAGRSPKQTLALLAMESLRASIHDNHWPEGWIDQNQSSSLHLAL